MRINSACPFPRPPIHGLQCNIRKRLDFRELGLKEGLLLGAPVAIKLAKQEPIGSQDSDGKMASNYRIIQTLLALLFRILRDSTVACTTKKSKYGNTVLPTPFPRLARTASCRSSAIPGLSVAFQGCSGPRDLAEPAKNRL